MAERSRARRCVALGIAVTLIIGGIAGLTASHGIAASKITSAIAIIAGLVFLNMARSRRSA
jgi:ABC-type xylose transport system permease subunit